MKSVIRNESGFTLTEVLVTIMLMTMVMFALYAMFDMSLRVYGVGNNTVETNENARVALDRMEREIRSAWHSGSDCGDSSSDTGVLLAPSPESTPNSITFWNCLSDSGLPTDISYRMDGGDLVRTEGALDPQPLAALGTEGTPLEFRYLDASNTDVSATGGAVLVEITLVAREDGQSQTLVTNAGLRNAS